MKREIAEVAETIGAGRLAQNTVSRIALWIHLSDQRAIERVPRLTDNEPQEVLSLAWRPKWELYPAPFSKLSEMKISPLT